MLTQEIHCLTVTWFKLNVKLVLLSVVGSPGKRTWLLHTQISGKALSLLKYSSSCSGTHVE